VIISNIVAYNAGSEIRFDHQRHPGNDIEDVRFNNIRIYYQGGGTKEQAALQPPEKEADYPEPVMFGEMPAYGFFVRHVRGLTMTDVEVSYLKDDVRPPFLLDGRQRCRFSSRQSATNAKRIGVCLEKRY
jgi:hypothetical protein